MATYVFAIGGTGARVLRSLTMLMASGIPGITRESEICPIIIDYDLKNGDKDRAVTCFKRYTAVRNLIQQGNPESDGFFSGKITSLDYLTDYCWQFDVTDENQSYKDFIKYDDIEKYTPITKKMIDSLYDTSDDPEYTELNINMRVGFQGNPNIGSVVFDDLKNQLVFKKFQTKFNPATDNVVIIGSVFGGTGASGIPKLVTAIHNVNATTNLKKANISVILVLPYFVVNSKNDGEEISIKSAIFNSKTKAALNYYEKSGLNDLINNIYYIGDKVPMVVEPHIGDQEQKNNANFVEVIAAMAVARSMTQKNQNVAYDAQNILRQKFKFNIATDSQDGLRILDILGTSNNWESNKFVKDIFHNLISFAFVMKYFYDEIVKNKDSKRWNKTTFYNQLTLDTFEKKEQLSDSGSQIPIQDFCASLYQFYCAENDNQGDDGFIPWLTELHEVENNKHGLKIFNLQEGTDIKDLLLDYPLEKEKKGFWGTGIGNSISKETLITYSETFDSCMNNALTERKFFEGGKGVKKEKESDRSRFPYFLATIMSDTGESLRTFNTELADKFKQIP